MSSSSPSSTTLPQPLAVQSQSGHHPVNQQASHVSLGQVTLSRTSFRGASTNGSHRDEGQAGAGGEDVERPAPRSELASSGSRATAHQAACGGNKIRYKVDNGYVALIHDRRIPNCSGNEHHTIRQKSPCSARHAPAASHHRQLPPSLPYNELQRSTGQLASRLASAFGTGRTPRSVDTPAPLRLLTDEHEEEGLTCSQLDSFPSKNSSLAVAARRLFTFKRTDGHAGQDERKDQRAFR